MKIEILKLQKIKWEGITDFPELYKYMKLHLEDIGYADERNLETRYIERAKPEGKKQLEISWHAEKKKSDFFVFNIDTNFLILGMSDTELQEEGIKRKMQKGVFEVRVSSYITSTDKWDELKGLQKMYERMIMKKRIDELIKELYEKSTAYFSYIKTFLGLRD